MSIPGVRVELTAPKSHYTSGDEISGTVLLDGEQEGVAGTYRLQVLWRTAGEGQTEGRTLLDAEFTFDPVPGSPRLQIPFQCRLPWGPWIYTGKVLRIEWAVVVQQKRGFWSLQSTPPQTELIFHLQSS